MTQFRRRGRVVGVAGVTIGQLAAYAGTTVRAVLHYHRRGLLPEPERDASGYRRYDAAAVIALTRIRRLATAGVPLARIPDLLATPSGEFGTAIDAIDALLAERIAELAATRARLHALRAEPDALVPEPVAGHLQRLARIGLTDQQIRLERDMWTLAHALYPQQLPAWIDHQQALLDQPDIADLYVALHAARDWPTDDPRLPPLAHRTAALAARHRDPNPAAADMASDPPALHLVNEYAASISAAWNRLNALAGEMTGVE